MNATRYVLLAMYALVLVAAHSGPLAAQGLLDRKVTFQVKDVPLVQALEQLSQKSTVKFAFQAPANTGRQRVTAQANNERLSKILKDLLTPHQLDFSLVEGVLVIHPASPKSSERISPTINSTLSGTVVDGSTGEPLVGAVVKIVGVTNQTGTDGNGAFRLVTGQSFPYAIQVSFVGYETKTLTAETSPIRIDLAPVLNDLEEVVVVGYGTQKSRDVTGAISSVRFTDLQNIPQSNTLNILSGRAPGLAVVQPGGQPGDDETEISIRGPLNTEISDSSPLVIIDGVQSTLKDLSTLPPGQIASISILKDASSAAIYGARGGNGVILVATKAPERGRLKLGVNTYFGLQKATYLPRFTESWQWMILHNEAAGRSLYPDYAIEDVKNGILTDTFSNNQPVNAVFRDAPISQFNVTLSGGNDGIRFQGAVSHLSQEGIMRNTDSKRLNYRSNIGITLARYLEAGLNLSGYIQNNHQGYYTPAQVLTQLYRTYPITPDTYANGSPGVYNLYDGTVIAPARIYMNLGRSDARNQKNNFITFLRLHPVKDFELKTAISYTAESNTSESFLPTYSYSAPNGQPALYNLNSVLKNGSTSVRQLQVSTTALYTAPLPDNHHLSLLAGHEYTSYTNKWFTAQGSGLSDNDLQVLDRATKDFILGGRADGWRLQSFFGRLSYQLKNRYLLDASLRADGSSRFPEDHRYGFFPSIGAAWIVSDEAFFADHIGRNGIMNHFKLRASYGKAGNDRIGNYTYQQTLSLDNYYYFGSELIAGAAQDKFANSAIRWETTTTKNLGLDMEFFNGRISLKGDWFDRLTEGLLYSLPLPPSFGNVTPATQNIGVVRNKGYEAAVDFRSSKGRLNYHVGLNVAYVKNRIVDLKGITAINGSNILQEGEDINAFYGYKTDGLFRTQEEVDSYPYYPTGFRIGSLKYVDLNDDGKIDDQDRTIIGTGSTPYTFGIIAGGSYGNIDFSLLFQGVKGKSIFIYDWGNRPANAAVIQFWEEWYENRFHPENNPDGTWPALGRSVPHLVSDFYVQDASYLRLKNVELGYRISDRLLRKIPVKDLRFYVSGQNIWTITSLIRQVDPERKARQQGNTNYPQVALYTVGLNVSL